MTQVIQNEDLAVEQERKSLKMKLEHQSSRDGFSLLEVMFAAALCLIFGAAVITSLMVSQRFASRARLLTNARAIVQRNIDAASGVAFTTSSTPSILAVTSGSGVTCDDDLGASSENIQVLRSGTNALVTGTLTRIVTAEPVFLSGTTSDPSVTVRRVTFRVDYNYLSINYTYSETTLRSADSQ